MPHYSPSVTIIEGNSGFDEGLIIGSMMAASQPVVVNETIVNETVYEDKPALSDPYGGAGDGGGCDSPTDFGNCDSSSPGDGY